MAVAVTNVAITAFNSFKDLSASLTANAATADTDGGDEVFTFTPTKPESKCLMIAKSTGALADGNVSVSVAAGETFAAGESALAYTLTKNKEVAVVLDGRYKQADGTFEVTFDPAATDKLKTDHALTVAFIELP